MGYFFPWGQLWDTAKATLTGDVRGAIDSIGFGGAPLSQLYTAISTNIDPFTKREIANPADPPARQLASWVNYMWRMGAPTWLTDIGAANKLLDALGAHGEIPGTTMGIGGTGENYRGQPGNTVGQAALRFLGINVYPIDPQESRNWNIRTQRKAIEDIRARRRSIGRDQRLSPEQRKARVEQINEYLKQKSDELSQYMKDSEIVPNLR
jgi:hypothetical protein